MARKVGEEIKVNDTIVEISTDKVDVELPSPASGTVTEILVQEGDTVTVGQVIARIAVGDGDAPDAAPTSNGAGSAGQEPSGNGAGARRRRPRRRETRSAGRRKTGRTSPTAPRCPRWRPARRPRRG